MALAVLGLCAPVMAQSSLGGGWRLQPELTLQQSFTDNVRLTPTDTQSEAITEVRAGLSLRGRSASTQGSLRYALSGFAYQNGSSPRSHQNSLNANLESELVDKQGFVTLAASIAQSRVSAFGTLGESASLVQANTTEVRSLRVSPRWTGLLAPTLDYNLSADFNASDASSSSVGRSLSAAYTANVSSDSGGAINWDLGGSRVQSGFGQGGRRSSSDRLTGRLRWRITDLDLEVYGSGGGEWSNQVSSERQSSATWGLGGAWVPSPRMRVGLDLEDRPFGTTHKLALLYRWPMTTVQLSSTRALSTSATTLRAGSVSTVYQLIDAQFQASEPDPVRRAELVEAYLRDNGLTGADLVVSNLLTSANSLQTNQTLSIALRGARSSLVLNLGHGVSRRVDRSSSVSDDLSSASEVVQDTASAQWTHRLTPQLSLTAELAMQRNHGDLPTQFSQQRSATLRASGIWTKELSWTVSARRALYQTATTPSADRVITGSIGARF